MLGAEAASNVRGPRPPTRARVRAADVMTPCAPDPIDREAPEGFFVDIHPRDPPQSPERHLQVLGCLGRRGLPPAPGTQGHPAEVSESTLNVCLASSSLLSEPAPYLKGGGGLDSEGEVGSAVGPRLVVKEGEARPAKTAHQSGDRLG